MSGAMRQRVQGPQKGAQMRPRQQQRVQQVQQAVQSNMPQMHPASAQQLTEIVGAAEVACMMQPMRQTILQKKVLVKRIPMMFIQTFSEVEPVEVITNTTAQVLDQPLSQVQLTSCIQPPVVVQPVCDVCPPCESSCGSCNSGPYQSGPSGALPPIGSAYAAAAAAAPFYNPYLASAAVNAPYATAAALGNPYYNPGYNAAAYANPWIGPGY